MNLCSTFSNPKQFTRTLYMKVRNIKKNYTEFFLGFIKVKCFRSGHCLWGSTADPLFMNFPKRYQCQTLSQPPSSQAFNTYQNYTQNISQSSAARKTSSKCSTFYSSCCLNFVLIKWQSNILGQYGPKLIILTLFIPNPSALLLVSNYSIV